MQDKMEKLLNQIGMSKDYLENSSINKIIVYDKNNLWEFIIDNDKVLPIYIYEELCNKIDELYREYSNDNIHETNMMEKAMTWYGIQKDTFLDDSTSKLADLLINGTNMGIIEGRKLLNNKIMDKKVKKICEEYIKFQERYLEKLKEFV